MRSTYAKHVLTMLGGTTVAQAIPVLVTPVLSRLFPEQAFGSLASYVAIATMLSVLSTGRYELAINLPKEDERGKNLLMLSLRLSAMTSVVVLLIVLPLHSAIADAFGLGGLGWLILLLPISVLVRGWFLSFNYWLNRRERFGNLAAGRIVRAGGEAGFNLGAGALSLGGGGLIGGTLLGQALGTLWLGIKTRGDYSAAEGVCSSAKMKEEARAYSDFPRFSLASDFTNIAANQLPMILMTALFSPVVGGLYYMTQRVLGAPIAMVGVAFGDVFKQRAAKDFAHTGSCRDIYVKTLKSLALLSFVPFLLVGLFGPWIFDLVLGDEWYEAGRYAQLFAPMFFLRFCISPLGQTLYIVGQQKVNLYWQIALLLCTVGSIVVGWVEGSALLGVGLMSATYSALYVVYLLLTWRASESRSA